MDERESILTRLEQRAAAVREGQPYESLLIGDGGAGQDEVVQLLATLLQSSFEGITLTSRESRRLLEVSDSFCLMTGYSRQELIGRTSVELGLVNEDRTRHEVLQRADQGLDGLYEVELRRRDGSVRWIEFSHQHVGDLILSIMRDVTERRRLEADLRHLADTDPLTGVLNRRRFRLEVERELLESRRFGDAVSLLIIDLDSFKAINDEHGHGAGDAVLVAIADLLKATVRAVDFVGRLGGDEFAVLLCRSEDDAARVAEELRRELEQLRTTVSGVEISVRASVGAATARGGVMSADALLDQADRAMYAWKRRS